MLKSILAIVALSYGFSAYAAPIEMNYITSIGYGVDGATGESVPVSDSEQMAAEVYKALGGTTAMVEVSSESPLVSIESRIDGFTLVIGDNLDDIKVSQKKKSADVALKGDVAQFLYNSLPVSPSQRAGGSLKQIANIQCSSALVSMGKRSYSCLLSNVVVVQMKNR